MVVHEMFSTKCIYALRAVFELSLREDLGVVKSQQIASSQGLPLRFLEIILSELRQGGFVESKRGNSGGYALARPAKTITVAEVIDFVGGHKATLNKQGKATPRRPEYPFSELWQELDHTCSEVLASANFEDLANKEIGKRNLRTPNYVI